jgi:beta-mannosidase
LWSEFEFGDALYQVDQPFLDNAAAEVVYNVRCVNHHPSLALWAGNNEIGAYMLPYVQYLDPADYGKYVAEYEKLFISLMLPLVYENSHISYNPGSTTNGYYYVNLFVPVPMAE